MRPGKLKYDLEVRNENFGNLRPQWKKRNGKVMVWKNQSNERREMEVEVNEKRGPFCNPCIYDDEYDDDISEDIMEVMIDDVWFPHIMMKTSWS